MEMDHTTSGGDAEAKARLAAERFARVRRANQAELAEDYVEMIDDLIAECGEARAADLADRFGVSPGTVARTIQRLSRDGLVESQPYRSIFLTAKGKQVADDVRSRHRLVHDFLVAIGVSRQAAELDAEGIEHHVGTETLAAFRRFLARTRASCDKSHDALVQCSNSPSAGPPSGGNSQPAMEREAP